MDGKSYYLAAVALTDRHPGTQFREMLATDSLLGHAERRYFRDEFRDLELMGWNTFCLRMLDSNNKDWLAKIRALDDEVILNHLQAQLMSAARDGKSPNRNLLEATVKALQGIAAATKIASDSESGGGDVPRVEVVFIGEEGDPVGGYGPLPAGAPTMPDQFLGDGGRAEV